VPDIQAGQSESPVSVGMASGAEAWSGGIGRISGFSGRLSSKRALT
jgi:hypothetical protein